MCELALLYSGRGRTLTKDLKHLVRGAWDCDELIPSVMHEILCAERETFKSTSNQGEIFVKGRGVDIGNFAYSLLYILMMQDALKNGAAPYNVARMYNYLTERYESLQINHVNWELKGDVIECILARATLLGPAIHPDDIKQHVLFMNFMRGFMKWFDSFLHVISKNGLLTDGPPLVRHLPGLHETVSVICELAEW